MTQDSVNKPKLEDIEELVREPYTKSWELTLTVSQVNELPGFDLQSPDTTEKIRACEAKFEWSDPEDAIIYHFKVNENYQNEGIGTTILELIEQFIAKHTEAQSIYASIKGSNGATEHVLTNMEYRIIGEHTDTSIGTIIDAKKTISRNGK